MAKRKHSKKTKKNKKEAHQPVLRPKRTKSGFTKIKVVGNGGGGGNAVTRMIAGDRLKGVEFIAINTDAQDLDYAEAHRKVYIGKALTKGLGTGMNPELGKQAAEENRSEIGEILEGADVVFITAGMGGGTGTGAAPVIAEIAKEKGILTLAIVTKPFAFEGAQRMTIALDGLARLKDKVDALVVVPNDRIFALIDKDTPLTRAFGFIDDILKNGVKAIAELVNAPGIINVDFADIRSILKEAGPTLVGVGTASGQDRSMKSVNAAINSPLLEVSMEGAKGLLFSVAGGRDLKMSEINDIAKAIAANLDSNAKVIFGAYHDRNLKDKSLKVTVIATGFNGIFSNPRIANSAPTLFVTGLGNKSEGDESDQEIRDRKRHVTVEEPSKSAKSGESQKTEVWEVPAFLRKKKR